MDGPTVCSSLDEKSQAFTHICSEQAEIEDIKFRYVTTKQNQADLAARGISLEELINNQLWFHGPSWLGDHVTKWPSWDFQQIDDNRDLSPD